MELVEAFNRDRLQWACGDFKISPEELAARAGISSAAINKILSDEQKPTFNQLRRIAEFFDRSILFFLRNGQVESEEAHSPEFRSLANQNPEISSDIRALIQRAEKQRDVFLDLIDDANDEDTVEFVAPEIPRNDFDRAARIVRGWLNLGNQNSFDEYRTAIEARGLLVFLSNGYKGKWQIGKEVPVIGFSLFDQRCPLIFVKKQRWETRQTFTLMHELAHLLLHHGGSIDNAADLASHEGREREANSLAGKILVPDEILALVDVASLPHEVSAIDEWLRPVARLVGASTEVMLRRLLDRSQITRETYAEYRAWWDAASQAEVLDDGGNRMWRYREPKNIFGNRYVRTVLDALSNEKITLARASKYLDGLKASDVRELERFYVGA